MIEDEDEQHEIVGTDARAGLDLNLGDAKPNAADEAWLRLYATRRDVKKGMLQDMFVLSRLGPPSLFKTADSFFDFVDALPGVPFHHTMIEMDGTPPFPFAWRSLLGVLEQLFVRHNGGFLDPVEAEMVTEPTDFIHGDRFRRLTAQLWDQAGPDAVLLPIILNSGAKS